MSEKPQDRERWKWPKDLAFKDGRAEIVREMSCRLSVSPQTGKRKK